MKPKTASTFATALLVFTVPMACIAQGREHRPARYTVTDLGTLGGANSFAYSISHSGVAGGSNTRDQNDFVAQTAFVWDGRLPIISLGTLGGSECPDCSSEGAAVSANGSVALLSETAKADPDGEDFCEFNVNRPDRTNHQCLAAIWRNSILTPLPALPGGHNAEAFFINKRGSAVGVSEIGSRDATCAMPHQVHRFHGVRWSPDGVPEPLVPLPEDTVSFAFTNNDRGYTVGFSGLCSNVVLPPFVPGTPSAPHAVLWDPEGHPHDLGKPPGAAGNNVAVGINNRNQVTMNSFMADGTIHAFVVTDGVLQELRTYPADSSQTITPCCNNINDLGQIVGFSSDASGSNTSALLWENKNEAPVDLNTVIPADSPWHLLMPAGITDSGEIAVTGINLTTYELHALVLSPSNRGDRDERGPEKPHVLPDQLRKGMHRNLRR